MNLCNSALHWLKPTEPLARVRVRVLYAKWGRVGKQLSGALQKPDIFPH